MADVGNEKDKQSSNDNSPDKAKSDKALAQLNKEYKEYKDLMQTLIESAAHELKSPVANLKLITLLIENTQDGTELLKYLDSIKTSISRLNASIVGLAKIFQTLNQEPEVVKSLNLKGVISESVSNHQQKISSENIKVENNLDDSLVITYPLEYLRFIFNELLENSLKYKQPDNDLKIKISGLKEKGNIKIIFEDNGAGMDLKKYGRNLFRAFKRFSQSQKGSGAGLFTIKTMIEKNKGRIEVESDVNKFTRITLFFKPYKVS